MVPEMKFTEPEKTDYFHHERLIPGDVNSVLFFMNLIQSGEVILVNEGGYVCPESALIVKTKSNHVHRMTVAQFVYLTEPVI